MLLSVTLLEWGKGHWPDVTCYGSHTQPLFPTLADVTTRGMQTWRHVTQTQKLHTLRGQDPQWSLWWWWWHSPHSGDRWPGAGWGWSVVTNVWCVLTPAPALMLCYRLVPDECGSQCSVSALVWLRSPVCECECGQSCGPGPNTETSPSSQWIGSRSTPKLAHSALTCIWPSGGSLRFTGQIGSLWERNVFWE